MPCYPPLPRASQQLCFPGPKPHILTFVPCFLPLFQALGLALDVYADFPKPDLWVS